MEPSAGDHLQAAAEADCAANSTSGWRGDAQGFRGGAGARQAGGAAGGARRARRGAVCRVPGAQRQAAELIQSFTQERDRFLHAVEREVVELALAVAARILRREAQMDPLLLTGAVRVALGQLSGSTQVKAARACGRARPVDRGHGAGAQPGAQAQPCCPERECGWATAWSKRNWDRWTWESARSWERLSAASSIAPARAEPAAAARGSNRCRAGSPGVTARTRRQPRAAAGALLCAPQRGQPWRWRGQVLESVGQTIESSGPLASVGECCEILDQFGSPTWPR
jgi:hypothetical protein